VATSPESWLSAFSKGTPVKRNSGMKAAGSVAPFTALSIAFARLTTFFEGGSSGSSAVRAGRITVVPGARRAGPGSELLAAVLELVAAVLELVAAVLELVAAALDLVPAALELVALSPMTPTITSGLSTVVVEPQTELKIKSNF